MNNALHRNQMWRVSPWNYYDEVTEDVTFVQMPHGGELLIPTSSRTEPMLVFGSIPAEDLISEDHMVRYKMRQVKEHKIAVRAVATTGRVGYIYQTGGKWALIIRNFVVNPSREYVDTPWEDLDDLGYSTQACNVNSELEYHIPAIGAGTGRRVCDDHAQVWAFWGGESEIKAIAAKLLGADY